MTHLKVGAKAPAFSGSDQNGKLVSLADYVGKRVVLYFYPKDDTPGCTAQACSLNESYDSFRARGFEVIGISPDGVDSHSKFALKYGLRFTLVSDPGNEIATNYGVWVEKNMYGKKYMGIKRTTFIIDGNGIIEEIIQKVDTKSHANQILG